MAAELFRRLETAASGTAVALPDVLDALAYDANGLVPVITQERDSGRVLMFAWMSRAALDETLATGRVCYSSRSRRALWRKGEQSGNVQQLVELRIDCDGDALLLTVEQRGPACHTGRRSCFYLKSDGAKVIVADAPERDPRDMYGAR
jgi:phosphoribosyl-AMP cyclohydrolase